MKKNLFIFSLLILLLSLHCKESKKVEEKPKPVMEKVDESGPEFTSRYICPMHCKGSGSDRPGKCPVCEMDYEQNESMVKDSIK